MIVEFRSIVRLTGLKSPSEKRSINDEQVFCDGRAQQSEVIRMARCLKPCNSSNTATKQKIERNDYYPYGIFDVLT